MLRDDFSERINRVIRGFAVCEEWSYVQCTEAGIGALNDHYLATTFNRGWHSDRRCAVSSNNTRAGLHWTPHELWQTKTVQGMSNEWLIGTTFEQTLSLVRDHTCLTWLFAWVFMSKHPMLNESVLSKRLHWWINTTADVLLVLSLFRSCRTWSDVVATEMLTRLPFNINSQLCASE